MKQQLSNLQRWYHQQDTLMQFLVNVAFFAVLYFVVYRLIIDIVPVLRDAKNDIRAAHINSILQLSQSVLRWFGIDTVVDTLHNHIITLSGKRVRMTPLCSGLMVTSVAAAFIISFPGRSLLYRLRFALIGAIIIYILNIIRVSVIAAQLASNNRAHIDFVQNYHKTVYDTLIYILVLVYIAVYVFRYSADGSKVSDT